jgi:acyl carrier protein
MNSTVSRELVEPLPSAQLIRKILIVQLAAVLIVEESQIDTSKPFDEYGLDSTDAIMIVGMIEDRIEMELEPELLIRNRTIEDVINYLKQAGRIE